MREAIIFLVVVGVAAFFAVSYFMNKFKARQAKIKSTDQSLKALLQRRLGLIEKLDRGLGQESSIGRSGISAALRDSKKATLADNVYEKGLLIGEVTNHLERVTMQMRNPNISEPNQQVLKSLDEIEEVNRKIKVAIRERNDEVREYNQMVNGSITGMVASIMKLEEETLIQGPTDRAAD